MPGIKQLEDQGRVLLAQQKSLVEDTTRNWSEKRDEYDRIEADVKSILEQHAALKSVARDPFAGNRDDAANEPKAEEPKSLGASCSGKHVSGEDVEPKTVTEDLAEEAQETETADETAVATAEAAATAAKSAATPPDVLARLSITENAARLAFGA